MKDPKKVARGKRLQLLRKRAGLGIEEAVARTGVPKDTLKAHEGGKRDLNNNADIYIEKYNVPGATSGWLLSGDNPPLWANADGDYVVPMAIRTVPKLTPSEAVTMPNAFLRLDEMATRRASREPVDDGVGPRAFALPIKDDSMVPSPPMPGLPSFDEGDIVVFDPDEECKIGNYVFAECGSKGVFRQLHEGDELVALNKTYKTLTLRKGRDRIIAKLVRHIKKY